MKKRDIHPWARTLAKEAAKKSSEVETALQCMDIDQAKQSALDLKVLAEILLVETHSIQNKGKSVIREVIDTGKATTHDLVTGTGPVPFFSKIRFDEDDSYGRRVFIAVQEKGRNRNVS